MNTLMSRYWEKRDEAKHEKGFTLIELLVVVVILGVLIAIAIPLYLNYRKGANDASAESDMRNAVSVLELCNTDNGKYPVTSTVWAADSQAPGADCAGQKINLSSDTTLTYTGITTGVSYILTGTNSSGTPKTYCFSSAKGGSVSSVADAAACATFAAA